jgi:threonylcarbamoyladenosine tRNA methylthiotransferase MtaB
MGIGDRGSEDHFSIKIYTLGCKLNQLESEAVAGSFRKAGFPVVQDTSPPGPGLIIINTCTVTSKADQKCRRLIRKALRDNPASCVLVTGCYAHLDSAEIAALEAEITGGQPGIRRLFILAGRKSGIERFDSEGDPDETAFAGASKSALLDLPGYLLQATGTVGNNLSAVLESWMGSARGETPFAFRPESFAFHSRGYLKIQDGCDNHCGYCRVRLARGPSVSLPREDALAQVRSFEERGCAELMITGVNITQYRYGGTSLAGLLEYLLEGSANIALRLSSLEPEGLDERLAPVLAHPRIRPHFHLSVQSGSETVLRRMGRAYTPQTVERGAALLRSAKDNPFLACDIIAGFPAETESEFAETISLCTKIGFAWIHAFPYSKRTGTPAFSLGNPVCERETSRRVDALTRLALEGRRNYARTWLGRELSAVVEKSPCQEGCCRAVSENYLKLIVNCSGERPPAGSVLHCVPESLCPDADGEKPDAAAKIARQTHEMKYRQK